MRLEAILARLQGVRQEGGGYAALCPAHNDKKPSTESDLKEKVNHSPQAKLSKPDYTTSSKL
jgi:hypothetical protein